MKILVFSDPHVGAGQGYGREKWDRLADQDAAFVDVARIAREHDVGAVLFAGDGSEQRKPTPRENLVLKDCFRRFDAQIIAVPGNHDVGEADGPCSLDLFRTNRFELHTTPGVTSVGGAAIACLPWTPISRLVAAKGGGERASINQEASVHLIEIAKGLRAKCAEKFPGLPAILLGHWPVEGAVTASGVEALTFAEPILPLADLEALGFAAVFMGHVHKPQELPHLGSSGRPIIIPGSPLPLSFGEAGDHGVWIFDTETGAAEFVSIESRRFVEIEPMIVEPPGEYDPHGFDNLYFSNPGEWEGVKGAIVKVSLHVTAEQNARIDRRKLAAALYEAGAWKVMPIIPDVERETRARDRSLDTSLSELEALDRWMETDGQPPEMQARMRETLVAWIEEGVA